MIVLIGLATSSLLVFGSLVFLVRRRIPLDKLLAYNQTIGNYIMIIAALYGVFVAFIALNLWEEQRTAEVNTIQEANDLASLFRMAQDFPEPQRTPLLKSIRTYTQTIIDKEWDKMTAYDIHEMSVRFPEFDNVWNNLMKIEPRTERDKMLDAAALGHYQSALVERHTRMLDSERGLVPYLWLILIGGALITLGLTYFLGMEDVWSHAILTGLIAAYLMTMLFAVKDLENPFQGVWKVEPKPYQIALEHMSIVLSEQTFSPLQKHSTRR